MRWRRLLLLGLLLALLPGAAAIRLAPDTRLPRSPTLRQGLLAWYLVRPPLMAGPTWWNLLPQYHGALTNMGAGSGWSGTARPGWAGEMRFDGSNDAVSLGNLARWDFPDMTFTIALRFRATVGAGATYLVAARTMPPNPTSGGYFIRLDTAGTLTVRVMDPGANPTAQRSTQSSGFGDGRWHSVVVVMRTDTVTVATNDVAIFADGSATDETGLTQTATQPYQPCTTVSPTCALMLGATSDLQAFLTGALDDIRIWQRGLSATEALAYHQETLVDLQARDFAYPWLGTLTPSVRRRVVIE